MLYTTDVDFPSTMFTNFPGMPVPVRLVWLFVALFGPVEDAEIDTIDVEDAPAIVEGLIASGLLEYNSDGLIRDVYEYRANSNGDTHEILKSIITHIRTPIYNVDNSTKNVDNPVDNPVDNRILADIIRSSSSNVVLEANDVKKNVILHSPDNSENPISKKRGRPRGPIPTEDFDFDVFWKSFPKDVGKKQALVVWKKIRIAANDWETLFAAIMEGLAWSKKSQQWNRDDGLYVPEAHRWLSKEKWLDRLPLLPEVEYTAANPTSSPIQPGVLPRSAPFRGLRASNEYVELQCARLDLEATGRMAPDGILADLADIELIRRNPLFRPKLNDRHIDDVLRTLYDPPRWNWRIGHKPENPDEWELELMLRETECAAVIAETENK